MAARHTNSDNRETKDIIDRLERLTFRGEEIARLEWLLSQMEGSTLKAQEDLLEEKARELTTRLQALIRP